MAKHEKLSPLNKIVIKIEVLSDMMIGKGTKLELLEQNQLF